MSFSFTVLKYVIEEGAVVALCGDLLAAGVVLVA